MLGVRPSFYLELELEGQQAVRAACDGWLDVVLAVLQAEATRAAVGRRRIGIVAQQAEAD